MCRGTPVENHWSNEDFFSIFSFKYLCHFIIFLKFSLLAMNIEFALRLRFLIFSTNKFLKLKFLSTALILIIHFKIVFCNYFTKIFINAYKIVHKIY